MNHHRYIPHSLFRLRYGPLLLALVLGCIMTMGCIMTTSLKAGGASSATPFSFHIGEAGRVSAAVYDADGRLVRTLLRGKRMDRGQHHLQWDGLNRKGEPMEPGKYTVKILRTPGFKAEFLFQLGVNPDSGQHHFWVGNLGNATRSGSVAVQGDNMYLGAGIYEIVPTLMKQSLDGSQRHWAVGGFGPYKGAVGLATNGAGTLYVLQPNDKLYVVDDEVADRLGRECPRDDRWLYPTHKFKRKMIRAVWEVGHEDGSTRGDEVSITADSDRVIVAYEPHNAVRWYDKDGKMEAEIEVRSPAGLSITEEGTVLVSTAHGVLEVKQNGELKRLVDQIQAGPLAYDSANKHILVADRSTHQIKRYSRSGELLRTYGREGGRTSGPYDPHSFRVVEDIAADGNGGFVVVEWRPAPRRTVHFDREGQIINEWFGGQHFFMMVEPDPRDPSQVWFTNRNGKELVLAEVDYAKRTWYPKEVHYLDELDERMGAGMSAFNVGLGTNPIVFYHDDQRYIMAESFPQVLRHDDGQLVPVVRAGVATHRFPHQKKWIKRITDYAVDSPDKPASFLWTDTNGDGHMQPGEVQVSEWTAGWYNGWSGFSVLDDGSLLATGYVRGAPEDRRQGLFEFPVEEWRDGVPYYRLIDEVKNRYQDKVPLGNEYEIASVPVQGRTGLTGAGAEGTLRDAKGNNYALWGVSHARQPDAHGIGSFTGRVSKTRLTKWDARGNEQWTVGRHWHDERIKPTAGKRGAEYPRGVNVATPPNGVLHAPAGLLGMTHNAVVVADRSRQPAQVWTDDGLYAGYFLSNRAADEYPEWAYHWWRAPESGEEALINPDCLHKGAIAELDNGDVIWFAPGRNSSPVYRISGWEGWDREEKTVHLDSRPSHARGEGSGLRGEYFGDADANMAKDADGVRVDEQIWFEHKTRFDQVTQWKKGVEPLDGQKTDFAVRWSGTIEARLSEPVTFSVYANGAVRLTVDGTCVIDQWEEEKRYRLQSEPIPLKAGERVSIQLEYRTTHKKPRISLNWDTFSNERERIPTSFLYPASPDDE